MAGSRRFDKEEVGKRGSSSEVQLVSSVESRKGENYQQLNSHYTLLLRGNVNYVDH